jgi:toxin ParE1/3/4
MIVRWTRRAIRSLDQLAEYIAEDNPDAADATVTRLLRAADALGQTPEMGRRGRVEGTRELVVPGSSYILAYEIAADEVWILLVCHGAQRWPDRF